MSFVVVIPARYASSRLPAKPLANLGGKAMVVRVAEQAQASGAHTVLVATDDERIATVVEAAGISVCLTRTDHPSGTDRLAEVVTQQGWNDEQIIVNLQGDEPLMPPALLRQVATVLAQSHAQMATLAHRLTTLDDLHNPNIVKVVCNAASEALYFSRAPIPWARDAFAQQPQQWPEGLPVYRHLGLYAYRAGFLRRYQQLTPSPLEHWEALEQLRVLWHGQAIAVGITPTAPPTGVDTPTDLARVQALYAI